MDSGVHPLLHCNCHHLIIYAKFNLKVFYHPPHERNCVAFVLFNWESSVSNLSINEQVSLFNEAIMNVISSFFLNELVFFDDFDPP